MSKENAQNRSVTLNPLPVELKCVAVGDGEVGKTSMLMAYTTDTFPEEYKPTVFDEWVAKVDIDGREYSLRLCDTAGQEAYDRLRPLSYSDTKVFLLCFSVTEITSFQNIKDKWIHEVRHYGPQAAVMLVGTKIDMRSKCQVSPQMAQAAVKEINAVKYMECSALTREGLKSVFDEAVRVAVAEAAPKKKARQFCRLL